MGRMHKIGIIKIVTQKRESEEKFKMTIKQKPSEDKFGKKGK